MSMPGSSKDERGIAKDPEDNGRVILPSRESMLQRLLAVSAAPWYQEHFYPTLLKTAGQITDDNHVVYIFGQAVDVYTRHSPERIGELYRNIPRFIDAIVLDSHAARREVKDYFANVAQVFFKNL